MFSVLRVAATLFLLTTGATVCIAASRPNIVVVVADDLGYGDLACFGSEIVKTPHLDQFAREGMKLTSCYSAASNCSPSRTGLMTGRTPYRVGVHGAIPFNSPTHVRESEITIATLLQQTGYTTCHVGKWHLNGKFNSPEQPQPNDHGFDDWFSTQNNALPNHKHPDNFVRNGQPVGKINDYAANIVADEAIRWLDESRDKTKPFFLYVCFHEPHEPIATDPKFAQQYPSDDPSFSAYHGNIAQMDNAFGRLMQKLDQFNLRENTCVLFTSDNGPAVTAMHPHGSAGPLRGKKGDLYDGGIRVPGIVRWPEHVPAGSESDQPVSGVDLLPSLCEITGTAPPADRTLDGSSVVPIFGGRDIQRDKPLYWQYNYTRTAPKVAVRRGDWKLLAALDAEAPKTPDITDEKTHVMKTAGLTGFELYNLKTDIGETTELSASHPDVFQSLKTELLEIYRQVQSETPRWPAWKHERYEAGRIIWPDYWLNKIKK